MHHIKWSYMGPRYAISSVLPLKENIQLCFNKSHKNSIANDSMLSICPFSHIIYVFGNTYETPFGSCVQQPSIFCLVREKSGYVYKPNSLLGLSIYHTTPTRRAIVELFSSDKTNPTGVWNLHHHKWFEIFGCLRCDSKNASIIHLSF